MCVYVFPSCCMHALNVAINQVAFATAAASAYVVVVTAAYVIVVVACCCCLLFTLCQQGQRRLLHVAQQAKN